MPSASAGSSSTNRSFIRPSSPCRTLRADPSTSRRADPRRPVARIAIPARARLHRRARGGVSSACRSPSAGARARPAAMSDMLPLDAEQIEAFLIATGIGLLIGLERERVPSARAGLRTFGLVGMLGALVAMLGEQLGSPAPFVAGLVLVGLTIIAAYLRQPDPSDPGTTSVAALVLCYCLGAASWLGHAQAGGDAGGGDHRAALLQGPAARHGDAAGAARLDLDPAVRRALAGDPADAAGRGDGALRSAQPAPDLVDGGADRRGRAWPATPRCRSPGVRYGAAFVGVFGGLASSTATTLLYARQARGAARGGRDGCARDRDRQPGDGAAGGGDRRRRSHPGSPRRCCA